MLRGTLLVAGVLIVASIIVLVGSIDLPLTWAALIAAAVFLYVLLDGFDLGLGILFPPRPLRQRSNRYDELGRAGLGR
jgi:hypothetical protein